MHICVCIFIIHSDAQQLSHVCYIWPELCPAQSPKSAVLSPDQSDPVQYDVVDVYCFMDFCDICLNFLPSSIKNCLFNLWQSHI